MKDPSFRPAMSQPTYQQPPGYYQPQRYNAPRPVARTSAITDLLTLLDEGAIVLNDGQFLDLITVNEVARDSIELGQEISRIVGEGV